MSKIPFFKFFSNSKVSVSDVNKYYVGVKPQPTMNCVGRIWKRSIKNSPCHPELAAPLVADEKEAYKGGCSQSISGSYHRQKCVTICNVSGKEVLDKVGWAFSQTLKYCCGRKPNLQKAISYASRKAMRHVKGDLVPTFTLAEFFSPYYLSPRRIAFTLAEVFLPSYHSPRKVAFTLAEVLITLGIIGVVAAMTLPGLVQKYNRKVLETSFKKAYSNLETAVYSLSPDTYATYSGDTPGGSTEFFDDLLAKYKIVDKYTGDFVYNKIYNSDIKTYNKTSGTYNPCAGLPTNVIYDGSAIGAIWNCGNSWIVLDTTGPQKGPNALGHDIFYFTLTSKGKILPLGSKEYTHWEMQGNSTYCSKNSTNSQNGASCAYFAVADICPDEPGKSYWECLP